MARIEELASPRILAGVAGDIGITYYEDGAVTDPSSATLGVVDEAGTVVIAAGTAATLDGGATGKVHYTLSAANNDRPKILTATWAITRPGGPYSLVAKYETVGELLFNLAAARAFDAAAMADTTTYPADTVLRARDEIHDAFETFLGFKLGARYKRSIIDGPAYNYGGAVYTGYSPNAYGTIELPAQDVSRVRTASTRAAGTATWTAFTAPELADLVVYPDGRVMRETLGSWPSGARNIAVEYEAGMQPIPLEIGRAALRLLRTKLVKSNLPDNAISQTDQLGTFSLAVAGRDKQPFGIPAIDAVLVRFARRMPVFR